MGTDRYTMNVPDLYAMYQAGWSLRAIGKLIGCHGSTIHGRFRRDNLPVEPYRHAIGPKYLAYWLGQGMTQTAIAKRLGVHRVVVAKRIYKYRKLGLLAPGRRKTSPTAGAACDAPEPGDKPELDGP